MENINDKSIMDRIVVDFEELGNDIHSVLDEFLQFRVDRRIRAALGTDCIERLKNWENNIKRRMSDDFSIVVIGDFKRGKSTLVNAILGEQLVTTNVTPETVTINRISYGEHYSMEAVLKDGRRAMLNNDELKREKLDSLIAKLPSPIEYIDIKAPVESLKGIRIVDTPGVGDILNRFDQQVKDYMINADAVIYVVSALSPLSITEQNFLCASILPQNFSKFFVVLNMMDCLECREDIERVKELINSRLSNIIPNSYVYALSGLDEYCRKKNLKRPNPELCDILGESFDQMYETLQRDVVMKKEIIQTERCYSMTKILVNEMEGRISLIDNMLLLNQNKLNDLAGQYENENSDLMKSIDKHKQSVKYDIREMHSEAKDWIEEFLIRLQNEIRMAENSPLEILEKHFHFYMMDTVRSAIIECTNAHLKNIAELLKNTSEAFANEFSNVALPSSATKIASSMMEVSWTGLDTASVALNFIPGLGPLTLLGHAILGFAKQKNTQGEQKKFIANVLGNYDQIKQSVLTELQNIYENMVQFAESQLDKIYESQVAASIEAIKQAQDISMKEDVDKEDVKAGIDIAKGVIETAKLKLAKFEKLVNNNIE